MMITDYLHLNRLGNTVEIVSDIKTAANQTTRGQNKFIHRNHHGLLAMDYSNSIYQLLGFIYMSHSNPVVNPRDSLQRNLLQRISDCC